MGYKKRCFKYSGKVDRAGIIGTGSPWRFFHPNSPVKKSKTDDQALKPVGLLFFQESRFRDGPFFGIDPQGFYLELVHHQGDLLSDKGQ